MVQSTITATANGKPLVLIVEDDLDLRETLTAMLVHHGYSVTTASNGREALALLRNKPHPGVVLLDLIMPFMNGWELVAIMAEDSALAGIPVVITSSSEPAPTKGVTRLLKKPLNTNLLLSVLHSLFSGVP
jgi:CheY-like chemotaxis protein